MHSPKEKNIRKDCFGSNEVKPNPWQLQLFKFVFKNSRVLFIENKGHVSRLTKVNQMLHLGYYIGQFGAALKWYGSPCESLHKWFVKKAGRKTQTQPDSFDH
eukprot:scaffold134661_cov37-Attheya_sp.AAC.3